MKYLKAALIASVLVTGGSAAYAGPVMGGSEGGPTAGPAPAAVYRHVSSRVAHRYRSPAYNAWAYERPTPDWVRAQEMGAAIVSGGGVSLR